MPAVDMLFSNRRTIKAPTNPLDKCTIVSIYPKPIKEIKLTVDPPEYLIPAGSYEKPSVLVIGPASWWKDMDPNQPLVEIQISSVVMAESIVKDYCSSVLCSDMANATPGLFFVLGEKSSTQVVFQHKDLLDQAKVKQENWQKEIVRMADVDWARTNGNPLSIPDEARLAAEMLGLKNKPWMQDFKHFEMKNCPACGHLYNPLFPMCANCKTVIDKKKYEEMLAAGV